MTRFDANKRRCDRCGREGHLRSMRYTIHGVYVCSNITACGNRQARKERS